MQNVFVKIAKCICQNCKMYLSNCKMYLSNCMPLLLSGLIRHKFVPFAKSDFHIDYALFKLQIHLSIFKKNCLNSKLCLYEFQMYLSQLTNMFITIDKHIYHNWQIYLSQLTNVFITIDKYVLSRSLGACWA